jgi:LysM repeat protein
MKKLLVVVCVLFSIVSANSQNLTVEGTAPELYVTHTVAPKENFYSVGRLYNQNAKAIASFNKLTMEKGLTIGQKVKIPLNSQNLGAGEKASGSRSSIPLTHVVAKSETLTKIGTDFNVTAVQIKKWNNLSADNIAPGTPLVVGHLNMESAPAAAQSNAPVAATKKTDVTPKKEVAAEKPRSFEPEPKKEELFETVEPVAKSETATTAKPGGYGRQNEKTVAVEEKPVVQEEPVKETPKKSSKKAAKEPVAKEEPVKNVTIDEPVKEKPVVEEEPVKETPKKSSKKAAKETVAKEEPVKSVSMDEPVKEELVKEEPKTKAKKSAKK